MSACVYVIFPGKRDFAGVIKLRILRGKNYLELSEWVQINHRGPWKREVEGSESEEMRQQKQSGSDVGSGLEGL